MPNSVREEFEKAFKDTFPIFDGVDLVHPAAARGMALFAAIWAFEKSANIANRRMAEDGIFPQEAVALSLLKTELRSIATSLEEKEGV